VSQDIKVGVVGFGLAGKVFHAPFVSAVPGLRLASIVERRGDAAAKAYPGVFIARSFDEMLEDPGIRLVVIGTPNETHFDLAGQALRAGRNVVIDKPFAASSAQARELIDLATAKNLLLAPFHNRRWDGDFLTVRKLLDQNTLGRLVSFESHFDRFRPIVREGTWKEAANAANGLLFDLGPHLVDQAVALFGTPQTVTASVRKDRDHTGIEDAFDVRLDYPHLTVWCRSTMVAADPAPRFLLHGTLGSFRKDGVDPQEPAIVAGAKIPVLGEGDWLAEDRDHWGSLTLAPNPSEPTQLTHTSVPTEPGDYRLFYANVRDALNGTAYLAVSAEAGLLAIQILELARESSRLGRSMPIDPLSSS